MCRVGTGIIQPFSKYLLIICHPLVWPHTWVLEPQHWTKEMKTLIHRELTVKLYSSFLNVCTWGVPLACSNGWGVPQEVPCLILKSSWHGIIHSNVEVGSYPLSHHGHYRHRKKKFFGWYFSSSPDTKLNLQFDYRSQTFRQGTPVAAGISFGSTSKETIKTHNCFLWKRSRKDVLLDLLILWSLRWWAPSLHSCFCVCSWILNCSVILDNCSLIGSEDGNFGIGGMQGHTWVRISGGNGFSWHREPVLEGSAFIFSASWRFGESNKHNKPSLHALPGLWSAPTSGHSLYSAHPWYLVNKKFCPMFLHWCPPCSPSHSGHHSW